MYALYIGILLSTMGRLQLKLPQRQAGKRHQNSNTQTPVTFDDVAGVDEAKEELEEIVVSLETLCFAKRNDLKTLNCRV